MVQHSREFALDQHEFERYIDGCRRVEDPIQRQECLFIAFVGGRLGLRAGEMLHFREDWIDWRNRMVDIPAFDPCTRGEDGGPCGYCRAQARQTADRSELTLAEARLEVIQNQLLGQLQSIPGHVRRQLSTAHIVSIDGDLDKQAIDDQLRGILSHCDSIESADEFMNALDEMAADYQSENQRTVQQVLDRQWNPKTENANRSVPFDWCPRAEITIERFMDLYDAWPYSMSALRRRVNKPLRLAHGLTEEDCKPHGLRATAATELAARGVPATTLKQVFGWSQISTAQHYVETSPERSRKQLYR